MTTYTYEITNLVKDGNGIVVTASFSITVKDGPDSFTHNYTTGFAAPTGAVIPFASLTEQDVIGWIIAAGGEGFEAAADAELDAFKQRKAAPMTHVKPGWAAAKVARQKSRREGRPE